MKENHDGHNLAFAQLRRTNPLTVALCEQQLVPPRAKFLPKIIDITKEFEYSRHEDTSLMVLDTESIPLSTRDVLSYPTSRL